MALPAKITFNRSGPQRVGIYARYSSGVQDEASIKRQIRFGKKRARALGAVEIRLYVDRAKSGISFEGREEFLKLWNDVEKRELDTVVGENMGRLSRVTIDGISFYEHLKTSGVRLDLHGSEQNDDSVVASARAAQRDHAEIKARMHGGRIEAALQGFVPNGPAYGYRPVPGAPGVHVVDEYLRPAIVEIFRGIAAKSGSPTVARDLQGRYPTPGERKEGTGESASLPMLRRWRENAVVAIVRNCKYRGLLVYNARAMQVGSDGVRRTVGRAEGEIASAAVPGLRIVDDALWEAANAALDERSVSPVGARQKNTFLFNGAVACGICGSRMRISGGYVCRGMLPLGKRCPGMAALPVETIDRIVLRSVAARFSSWHDADYETAQDLETLRLEIAASSERPTLEALLLTARASYADLKARSMGGDHDAGGLRAAAAEIVRVKANIARCDRESAEAAAARSVAVRRDVALSQLARLSAASLSGVDDGRFAETVRAYVKRIVVSAPDATGRVDVGIEVDEDKPSGDVLVLEASFDPRAELRKGSGRTARRAPTSLRVGPSCSPPQG